MNFKEGPVVPEDPPPRQRNGVMVGLMLAMVAYGVGYLVWYLGTPLSRAPQLDGAENLSLAGKIATGTLPVEPFYRAMLYPAVLALPLKFGLPVESLPGFASIFGLLCHFAITLAVARLAARLWAGPKAQRAALLATVFWGFNPVALFYAVDVLDTVPSLALFAWGLGWWARPGAGRHDAWVGGVFLGLAVAARPHFLPIVLIAPLARAWLAGRWKPQTSDALAFAGAFVILLILGGVQKWWGGEFRILPWQSAYNFYAANKPDANGRYYAQQKLFEEIAFGENPTRKESEAIYAKVTSAQPPFLISAMNSYWRSQSWTNFSASPGAWLKLMAKKAYYLLNDFDQYNNKTFAWHRAESPWLKGNYLGWGILFVLAAGAFPLAWRPSNVGDEAATRTKLIGLLLVFCVYGTGVLLYYTSGRFRLPLTPLLCILAGGWATNFPVEKRKATLCFVAMLLPAFLAWSNFFNARDDSTFIQDELLSANASAQLGDDAQAIAYAERALQRDPQRPDARRVAVVSFFNLTVADGKKYDTVAGWQRQLKLLAGLEPREPTLTLVAGMARWKIKDYPAAEKIWQEGADRFGPNSMTAKALATGYFISGNVPRGTMPPDMQLLEYMQREPNR